MRFSFPSANAMKLLVPKILMTVCLLGASSAARADDAALRRLAACPMGGQLQVLEVKPRDESAPWREVASPSGPLRVSVASGYRVMLGVPGYAPFVNLKLERSAPDKFADDMRAIKAHMEGIVRHPLTLDDRNGVTELLAENASIEGRAVIGMASVFHEPSRVIATAYFLNAKPGQRAFNDQPQYAALRTAFLQALQDCLRRQ